MAQSKSTPLGARGLCFDQVGCHSWDALVYVQVWRYPQNRKYITYHDAVRRTELRPKITGTKILVKIGCVYLEIRPQTDKHTQTDMVFTILHSPIRGGVIINNCFITHNVEVKMGPSLFWLSSICKIMNHWTNTHDLWQTKILFCLLFVSVVTQLLNPFAL